ncbi:MAG: ribbon-helix-helix protein, CopG family [Nostoc sp. GBBB01]|nr:ribbon-helix-helix protein, CopG family [Nostoc sp. GBBB01]
MSKKTLITLNLSDAELDLLNSLSEKKDMNKSAVLRQALRMMGLIEQRIEQGEKFYFETVDEKKSELILV